MSDTMYAWFRRIWVRCGRSVLVCAIVSCATSCANAASSERDPAAQIIREGAWVILDSGDVAHLWFPNARLQIGGSTAAIHALAMQLRGEGIEVDAVTTTDRRPGPGLTDDDGETSTDVASGSQAALAAGRAEQRPVLYATLANARDVAKLFQTAGELGIHVHPSIEHATQAFGKLLQPGAQPTQGSRRPAVLAFDKESTPDFRFEGRSGLPWRASLKVYYERDALPYVFASIENRDTADTFWQRMLHYGADRAVLLSPRLAAQMVVLRNSGSETLSETVRSAETLYTALRNNDLTLVTDRDREVLASQLGIIDWQTSAQRFQRSLKFDPAFVQVWFSHELPAKHFRSPDNTVTVLTDEGPFFASLRARLNSLTARPPTTAADQGTTRATPAAETPATSPAQPRAVDVASVMSRLDAVNANAITAAREILAQTEGALVETEAGWTARTRERVALNGIPMPARALAYDVPLAPAQKLTSEVFADLEASGRRFVPFDALAAALGRPVETVQDQDTLVWFAANLAVRHYEGYPKEDRAYIVHREASGQGFTLRKPKRYPEQGPNAGEVSELPGPDEVLVVGAPERKQLLGSTGTVLAPLIFSHEGVALGTNGAAVDPERRALIEANPLLDVARRINRRAIELLADPKVFATYLTKRGIDALPEMTLRIVSAAKKPRSSGRTNPFDVEIGDMLIDGRQALTALGRLSPRAADSGKGEAEFEALPFRIAVPTVPLPDEVAQQFINAVRAIDPAFNMSVEKLFAVAQAGGQEFEALVATINRTFAKRRSVLLDFLETPQSVATAELRENSIVGRIPEYDSARTGASPAAIPYWTPIAPYQIYWAGAGPR